MTLTKISTAAIEDNAVTTGKIADGAIVNADINASAAIAGTKVSPNFGSQNVVTTGTLGSNDITLTGGQPALSFIDDGANPDYKLYNNNGVLRLYDITNTADRLVVNTDGHVDVTGNLDVGAGLDVTGDIAGSGSLSASGFSTTGGEIALTGTVPRINLVDSNANSDFRLKCDGGSFHIEDITNAGNRLSIATNGNTTVHTKLGVGTTSNGGKLTVLSTSSTYEGIELQTPSGDSSGEFHIGVHQSGATSGRSLVFKRGGSDGMDTESIRIDPNGRLGIGKNNPSVPLHVYHGSTDGVATFESGDANALINFRDNSTSDSPSLGAEGNNLKFVTGSSTRMRLDSGGRLMLNMPSPLDTTAGALSISGGTSGGRIAMQGTTANANTNIAEFFSHWGTNKVAGFIARSGTDTTNKDDGELAFFTRASGQSLLERLTIDTSGRVKIGTTTEGHGSADDLTINNSGHGGITIRTGTTSNGAVFFSDGTSGAAEYDGYVQYNHGTDPYMQFGVGGNSRMFIRGGNVGIGTNNSPDSKLKLQDSNDLAIHLLKTGSQDTLIRNTGQTEICAATGGSSGQRIAFKIGANTGSLSDIAKFTVDGLCFGSDTAAANALDDYEEGTWTPTINTSLNANIAVGRYVKVGSLVMASGRLDWNSNSGAGGGIGMGGLPFATHSGSNTRTAAAVGYMIGFDTSGNHQLVMGAVQNTTNMYVQLLNDNGAGFAIGAQNCSNSGEIQFTITYRTDA